MTFVASLSHWPSNACFTCFTISIEIEFILILFTTTGINLPGPAKEATRFLRVQIFFLFGLCGWQLLNRPRILHTHVSTPMYLRQLQVSVKLPRLTYKAGFFLMNTATKLYNDRSSCLLLHGSNGLTLITAIARIRPLNPLRFDWQKFP